MNTAKKDKKTNKIKLDAKKIFSASANRTAPIMDQVN